MNREECEQFDREVSKTNLLVFNTVNLLFKWYYWVKTIDISITYKCVEKSNQVSECSHYRGVMVVIVLVLL